MDAQEYDLHEAKAIIEDRAVYGDTQHPLSRGPVILGPHVQEGILNPEACAHIDCGSISTFSAMYFPLVLYYADVGFSAEERCIGRILEHIRPECHLCFPGSPVPGAEFHKRGMGSAVALPYKMTVKPRL